MTKHWVVECRKVFLISYSTVISISYYFIFPGYSTTFQWREILYFFTQLLSIKQSASEM